MWRRWIEADNARHSEPGPRAQRSRSSSLQASSRSPASGIPWRCSTKFPAPISIPGCRSSSPPRPGRFPRKLRESFVREADNVVPGYTQKIAEFCRRFGKFRPRFVTIGQPTSLAESLALAANEGAISLNPSFISHLGIPNVVMVPIADKEATWDLFVVWQRGKTAGPLRALLDTLRQNRSIPEPV